MLRTSLRIVCVCAKISEGGLFLSSNAQDFIEESWTSTNGNARTPIPEQ